MAWDPTHPATSSAVVSAGLRDNFGALDTLLVAPLTALANNQVLVKAAGPVVAGVPAGTNGYVLTLVGGVPLWQPAITYPLLAPAGTAAAPSYAFAAAPGSGLYLAGGNLAFVATGFATAYVTGSGLSVLALDVGTNNDTILVRDAAGVLAQRNGANLQKFRVYADATNYLEVSGTHILVPQTAAPTTPAAGWLGLYGKTDKQLYVKDDLGLETPLSGLQSPMVALGDLIVGGASGAPARLGVGTTGQVLTVASGTPTWAAPTGGGGGVSALRLPLEQATLPDGTTGNVPPEFVREKSTGTLSGAPSPARTYARFAGDSAAVMESLMWSFLLPSNYGSGGTIRLKWKAAVATTGAVIWKAGAAPVTDGTTDDDAVAFTAVTTASASTAPATQGQSVEVSLALTTMGFAALRWVTVFVARDPVAAADTMTGTGTAGDAILMGVQFEYTAA